VNTRKRKNIKELKGKIKFRCGNFAPFLNWGANLPLLGYLKSEDSHAKALRTPRQEEDFNHELHEPLESDKYLTQ